MLTECPTCDKTTGMELVTKNEEFEIRGEKINVPVQMYHCRECDSYFCTSDLEDPFKIAYREYRQIKGMVQPEEITDFRKKYNLTQKELSDLLGFGDDTLSRYENGSLQDTAHDRVLKLTMEPRNFLEILNREDTTIAGKKKAEIIKAMEDESSMTELIDCSITDSQPNEFNGFSKFNVNKTSEIIKFLCFNKDVYKTKLMKLLFYSDFFHYKKYQKSITGLKYAHLTYGPVPNDYNIVLGVVLRKDKSLDFVPSEVVGYDGEIVVAKIPPSVEDLTRDEMDTLSHISKIFDRYTSKQISEVSHNEIGYKSTQMGELISYKFADQLSIE